MINRSLLKDSRAYYEENDFYEIFSKAEDKEGKVACYLKNLSLGQVVLDAGCGTGKFLPVLEASSKKYIGIDLSKEQLKKAEEKRKRDTSLLIQSNLAKIPLVDQSIDLIISTWVLGTIPSLDERKQCLEELKRVLKPGGKILLVENEEGSEFEAIRNRTIDHRTKDYNDWILSNGFTSWEQISTYFLFESLEEAKKCFEVIYGTPISNKIKDKRIEHKIVLFGYEK